MTPWPAALASAVDEVVGHTAFSGVVSVARVGDGRFAAAYGLADRAHDIGFTVETRVGVASGAKAFTALTVMRLVEDRVLGLAQPVRDLLGDDLPLIDDRVTVEHLLAHRSGIGDYLDESVELDRDAHLMPVPVHQLDTAESYLAVLGGYPQGFEPGTDFAYCNGGYVVLALVAERAAGMPFHDLVQRHVIERAALERTAYLRTDGLPGDAALGYLHPQGHPDALRTNVLHLPVVGGGDGGIFTTADDVERLWRALDDGHVVRLDTWSEMRRPRSQGGHDAFGLAFRRSGDAIALEGCDTGASFRSEHLPGRHTWSVLGNTADGAWPVAERIRRLLG